MSVTPRKADDDADDDDRRPSSLATPSTNHHHYPAAYADTATSAFKIDPTTRALLGFTGVQALDRQATGNSNANANGSGNGNGSVKLTNTVNGINNTIPSAVASSNPDGSRMSPVSIAGASNSDTAKTRKAPFEAASPSASNGHLSPPLSETSLQRLPLSLKAQGKVKAVDMSTVHFKSDEGMSTSSTIPGRQCMLSHSQLFRAASPPKTGNGSHQIPLETLKSELNEEDVGLVPLAAVIERVASEAYETLQNLGETMSSLPSASKRSRIFDTALELRTQMIKLYVLTKWAKGGQQMQHITNIIGLTHEQSFQTVDARDYIRDTRDLLPNARGRNHDIITAIDVLAAGEPQRLPKSITDAAMSPKPLSDNEVCSIVEELDAALRKRLTSHEPLPLALQPSNSYRVCDGRVEFTAKDLFTFALTLSGDRDDDRWYLLSITFDYNITGTGKERFPNELWDSQRESFIAGANEILAPRSGEIEGRGDVPSEPARREATIIRLYNFLQSQALEYQLDILAFQLSELSRLSWRGSIAWHWEQRLLVVKYWTKPRSDTSRGETEGKKWSPVRGGVLKLQVVKEQKTSAGEDLMASLSRKGDRYEDGDEDASAQLEFPDRERCLRLTMQWELDEHLASHQSGPNERAATVDAQCLDAEALLRDVTAEHAKLSMTVLKDRLGRSSGIQNALKSSGGSIEEQVDERGAALLIQLHETLQVRLHLEAHTGRLSLTRVASSLRVRPQHLVNSNSQHTLLPSLSGSSAATRFREATRLLNDAPGATTDILLRLRIAAICDNLETKSTHVGLACLRRLNLNQEEYVKLGNSQPSSLLFFPLAQCPTFYIVTVARDYGIEVGLMSAMPLIYGDGNIGSSLVVQTLQWLDVVRIISSSTRAAETYGLGKRRRDEEVYSDSSGREATAHPRSAAPMLQGSDLARLHSYATALTLSAQIESHLQVHGTPFIYIPSSARRTLIRPALTQEALSGYHRGQGLVPTITLRTRDLFGPTASTLLRRSAVLKLRDFWNVHLCHVCLVAKLQFDARPSKNAKGRDLADRALLTRIPSAASGSPKLRKGLSASASIFDARTSTIIFLSHDLPGAVENFQVEWIRIAKVASLAAHIVRACPQATLRYFDLEQVRFAYASQDDERSLICQVRWEAMDTASLPMYRLTFSSSVPSSSCRPNPHVLITRHLEKILNASATILPDWSTFLTLLEKTLQIVSILDPLLPNGQTAVEEDQDLSQPDVEVITATWYRVIFAEKYTLVVRLAKDGKVCVSDAAATDTKEGLAAAAAGGDDKVGDDVAHSNGAWTRRPVPQLKQTMASLVTAGVLVFGSIMLLPTSKIGLLKELIEQVNKSVLTEEGLK